MPFQRLIWRQCVHICPCEKGTISEAPEKMRNYAGVMRFRRKKRRPRWRKSRQALASRLLLLTRVDNEDEHPQPGQDPFPPPADVQPEEESSSDPTFFRGAATLCSVMSAGAAVIYLAVWLSAKTAHGGTIDWLRDQGTVASVGLVGIGFIFGIIALFGIVRHGAGVILPRAATGLGIGLVFFGVFTYGFVHHLAQVQAVYARETNPSMAAAKITKAATPLTDGECEAFANELNRHFESGDKQYFLTVLDLDGLLDRLVPDDSQVRNEMRAHRAEFEKGFNTSLGKSLKLIESFKCLRLKRVDGEARWLCRIINTSGGLTYAEMILDRVPGGVRIVDMYYYTTGERVSQTVNRLFILPSIESHKSLLDSLFAPKSEIARTYPLWSEIPKMNADGHQQQVLDTYKKLPPSVQKEKLILLNYLQAALHLDPEAYRQGVELWRSNYPNDPATDLLSMPVLTDKKEYQEALACGDRLNIVIGGDAYLDYLRARLNLDLGDKAKAKELAEHAIETEPTLAEPYFFEVHSLGDDKQFAAAVTVLDRLCTAKKIRRADLAAIVERAPVNAALVKSTEYQQWRATAEGVSPPTRIAAAAPVTVGPYQVGPNGLKLQSILYQPSHASAMISGKYVMVGDKIYGHTVLSIEPDSVTIQAADGAKTVFELE